MKYTVLGVLLILLSLWGGTWLHSVVPELYQPAAGITSALTFAVGVCTALRGLD